MVKKRSHVPPPPRSAIAAPVAASADPWRPMALRLLAVTAITLAALLLWRGEVLPLPPFYETAMGLFWEADFLAETNFDYTRLRLHEPAANDGGAFCYMTSAMPTVIAVLMKTLPTTAVFVVTHLLSFLCAALIVAVLYELLTPRTDRWFAAVVCAAAITTPMAMAQVEMIGMDVPMAAFAMLALLAVTRERFSLAALAGACSFMMKPTGLIVGLTVICLLMLRLTTGWLVKADQEKRRALLIGLLVNLAVVVAAFAFYRWGGVHVRLRRMGFADSWWINVIHTCPDLLALAVVCLLAGAWGAWRGLRQRRRAVGRRLETIVASAHQLATERPELVFSAILIVGDLAAMVLYTRVYVIRYMFVTVPLGYLLLGSLLYRPEWRRLLIALPAAMVALNVYNADGRLLPQPLTNRRHCGLLERSREYLADLRSSMAAMQAIERESDGAPIVVGYPYSYYLARPNLGYVSRPLPCYGMMPLAKPNNKNPLDMFKDHPTRLVFVSAENPSHRYGPISAPSIDKGDRILYRDAIEPPLVVFEKDLSALKGNPRALDLWYIDRLWAVAPAGVPPELWRERARHLAASGMPDYGIEMLEARLRRAPDDLSTRIELAETLIQNGQSDRALRQASEVVRQAIAQSQAAPLAAFAQGQYLMGLAYLQGGQIDAALPRFAEALQSAPDHAEALFQTGVCQLAENQNEQAIETFRRAVTIKPSHAQAHYHLGLALARVGQTELAMAAYEQALANDPNLLNALAAVAPWWGQHGRAREAVARLRGALANRPDWLPGVHAIAQILATADDPQVRNPSAAVQYAEEVCLKTERRDPVALATLATAYAATGNPSAAVAAQEQAVAVATEKGMDAASLRSRLEELRAATVPAAP
ncbi:MAG: tetratricopeptide repeat protein [Pirellulales bacterium]|nr:tetratricopeptide repeat protein [Pirellulales bacterium]